MTAPSFTNSTLTVANRIGRQFSIVSMLPALFLVLWTYALIASGAWRNAPDLKSMTARTSHWSLAGVAWLIVATLLVALLLHPLQFAMTQLLEGYWGNSSVAIGAMKLKIVYYRKRQRQLKEQSGHHYNVLRQRVDQLLREQFMEAKQSGAARESDDPDKWNKEVRDQRKTYLLRSERGDQLIVHVVSRDAAEKRLGRYPQEINRVMPTRLGNALRRFEDAAGSQYGLDTILTAPYFLLIAPDEHKRYVRDSRQQMDTTISLCTVSFLATIIAVVFLLTDGLWLLVSLVPYALAYVAYRGAVEAAYEYATAVTTVIDLNRFQLYESLRIDAPRDTKEERAANMRLMTLLGGEDESANVRYSRNVRPTEQRLPRRPRKPG